MVRLGSSSTYISVIVRPQTLAKGTDKLLLLRVKLGEEERQIVAGIRKHYEGIDLIGRQIVIVANLEPRVLRGETSHGMLLAASDEAGNLALLQPDKALSPGATVS